MTFTYAEIAQEVAGLVQKGLHAPQIRQHLLVTYGEVLLQYLNAIPRQYLREFLIYASGKYINQMPVLDVGCGYRTNYPEVTEGRLVPIPAGQYIAFDHVLYPQAGEESGSNLVASATSIPIASSCIRTVICTELLEHVYDDRLVIAEIVRVLIPGGILILTVPGEHIPNHEKLPHQPDYRRYVNDDLLALTTALGLKPLEFSNRVFSGFETNQFLVAVKS